MKHTSADVFGKAMTLTWPGPSQGGSMGTLVGTYSVGRQGNKVLRDCGRLQEMSQVTPHPSRGPPGAVTLPSLEKPRPRGGPTAPSPRFGGCRRSPMSRWRGQRGQRPGSPAYLTGAQGPGCLCCKAGGARGREDSTGPVALRKRPSAVRAGCATFGLSGLAKPNIFFFFF